MSDLKQQVLDFALPADKKARQDRLNAIKSHWFRMIESIVGLDCLTIGRRKTVVRFLKEHVLKSKNSAWDGTMTFVQTWLAKELEVHANTIGNWLKWARELGAVDWSTDTDGRGNKRTTVQFTWVTLAARLGCEPLPTEQPDSDSLSPDQTTMVGDQTTMVGDQTTMVGDQTTMVVRHSGIRSTSPNHVPTWKATETDLCAIGMDLPKRFIRAAQNRNVDIATVNHWIATYQANATLLQHNPGSLFFRLREGQWPVAGVVDPDEHARRAAAVAARRAEQDAERAQQRAELREQRRELLILEDHYGAILDQLSDAAHEQLAERTFQGNAFMLAQFRRQRRSAGRHACRHDLLAQLHKEQPAPADQIAATKSIA